MLSKLSTLALFSWGIHTCCAQTVGSHMEFSVTPTENIESYGPPQISKGMVIIRGTAKTKEAPSAVFYRVPLDGGTQEEIRLPEPTAPGEVIASYLTTKSERLRLLIQSWDKATGEVTIFIQPYEADGLRPSGPLTKVGVVPLDRGSYNGRPLGLWYFDSPDGSKNLVYFDGIQSGGIKLAMCWVIDDEGESVWHAAYRIPVQAYGAQTTVSFTNLGAVIVEVEAVLLDERNTVENRDGEMKAKVDKTFYGKTDQTFFLLSGDVFLNWDGTLPGSAETKLYKVVSGPDGLYFLASTVEGKKDEVNEWVFGRMDNFFKPEVIATGKLSAPFVKILNDSKSGPYGICRDREDIAVLKFGLDGTLQWMHEAPLSRDSYTNDFQIAADRLVYCYSWSPGSIKNLTEGSAAKLDLNAYIRIPTVISWKDGNRAILPLYPLDVSYKEGAMETYESSICNDGILLRNYGQKEPSFTFIPIDWK